MWYDHSASGKRCMHGCKKGEAIMAEFISANLSIVLCFLFGIGLLVAEVFIPGFGLPGISGIVLQLAAIVLIYINYGGLAALGATIVILAVLGIAISIALRSINRGRLSKSALILQDRETADQGYVATADMDVFLGKEGVTTTVLRPTGMAEFSGVKLNVIADGEYIDKGATVRVERVDGASVVVKKA